MSLPRARASRLDTPWKEEDRIWFEKNPTALYRFRAPLPQELDGFVLEFGTALADSVERAKRLKAEHGKDASLVILVIQVIPGHRSRVPGIKLTRRGKVSYRMAFPWGEETTNDATVAALVAQVRANSLPYMHEATQDRERMLQDDDECALCGNRFRDVDLNIVVSFSGEVPRIVCAECGVSSLKTVSATRSVVIVGLSLYLSKSTLDALSQPEPPKELTERVKAMAEIARSLSSTGDLPEDPGRKTSR